MSTLPSQEAVDELAARCDALSRPDEQGEALQRRDYVLLAVATIALPALLVLIGSAL